MFESIVKVLVFTAIFALVVGIYKGIKALHYKLHQVGEPEQKQFADKEVTIFKLKDLEEGNRIIVARVVSEEALPEEIIMEIGESLKVDVLESRFYTGSQYGSKYATYRNGKVRFEKE
ncbi:MAG: hypothetical protein IJQ95_07805 [Paludibacteraceae bacterium]|nr:hypothetical protein [Paludibacteraceae bacterium]